MTRARVPPPLRIVLCLLCLLCPAPSGFSTGQSGTVRLGSIDFDGNESFKGDRLRKLLSVREESPYAPGVFDTSAFGGELQKLVAFYSSEGFRQCRAESYTLSYNRDSTEADLNIRIIEGPPTTIDTIVFTGSGHYSREELLGMMDVRQGERYERERAGRGRSVVMASYRAAGYLDVHVKIVAEWGGSDDRCRLLCEIDENRRFAIGEVRVEGLRDVRSHLLTRELRFAKDEFVDLDKLAESQRKLYETNLFRSVSIKPVETADSSSTMKDILVRVIEEEPGQLELAGGIGSIEKARGSALLSYDNTFGQGYRTAIGGKISTIEQTLNGSIDNPWIFGIPWGLSFVGTGSGKEEPSYDILSLKGQLNFYKKFLRRSRFTTTVSYETGSYKNLRFGLFEGSDIYPNATPEEIEGFDEILKDMKLLYDRAGLKGTLQYDMRDNLFDPSTGYYLDVSSEFVYGTLDILYKDIVVLPSINHLVRSEVFARFYYPLDQSTKIATSLEAGIIVNMSGDRFPFLLDDLFYAGGPTSLRGFDYKRVGPISNNGSPLGGELKLVWNLIEIRRRIIWIFGAVVFFDVGNVWSTPSDFHLRDLRYSPGAGIRIDSPIGIVRFDYGFNPWPKTGEANGQFWFGIGHAF